MIFHAVAIVMCGDKKIKKYAENKKCIKKYHGLEMPNDPQYWTASALWEIVTP